MLTHCGTIAIETKRLLLRRFQMSDAPAMRRNWAGDSGLQALYSEPAYKTDEEVKGFIAKCLSGYENGDYYRWALIYKPRRVNAPPQSSGGLSVSAGLEIDSRLAEDSGENIGQIAVCLTNDAERLCEIEYCVGRKFQNMGLATEAARAVIDFAFNRIGFDRVRIWHKDDNQASRRVIEKCGCSYDETFSHYFCFDDRYVDLRYYSIAADQWNSRKESC